MNTTILQEKSCNLRDDDDDILEPTVTRRDLIAKKEDVQVNALR